MFCGRSERCPAAEPGAGEHSQDCRSAEHERSRPGAHRPALWTDSQGLHAPSHRGGCTELHGDGVGVHADRRAFWKHTHGTRSGPAGRGEAPGLCVHWRVGYGERVDRATEKPPGGWPRRTGRGRVSVRRAADSGGGPGRLGELKGVGQAGSASASGVSGSGRRLEWAFAYCCGPIHV